MLGLALLALLSSPGAVAQQSGLSWRVLLPRVAALEAKTSAITRQGSDLFLTGVNVHIHHGSGATEGGTGRGNLIVGYNELRGPNDVRTGAHNLVVGPGNNFASSGCAVFGYYNNRALGRSASVSGGRDNVASGPHASVAGGRDNSATVFDASVSGGQADAAADSSAWVGGGTGNAAGGVYASLGGGGDRSAAGDSDWRARSLFQDFLRRARKGNAMGDQGAAALERQTDALCLRLEPSTAVRLHVGHSSRGGAMAARN